MVVWLVPWWCLQTFRLVVDGVRWGNVVGSPEARVVGVLKRSVLVERK